MKVGFRDLKVFEVNSVAGGYSCLCGYSDSLVSEPPSPRPANSLNECIRKCCPIFGGSNYFYVWTDTLGSKKGQCLLTPPSLPTMYEASGR